MSLFKTVKKATLRFGLEKVPPVRFLARLPFVKRTLVLHDLFQGPLEEAEIVTYDDKIRYRGPLYNRHILFGQEGHDLIGTLIDSGKPAMVSRLGSVELACLWYYRGKRSKRKKSYPGAATGYAEVLNTPRQRHPR